MGKKNEKVLERVRKLLAMSKDKSSQNEAMIAAKRARFLMDKYQITELDLADLGHKDIDEFQYIGKKNDLEVDSLCITMARLNDCQVKATLFSDMCVYFFQGMEMDARLAIEMVEHFRIQMYFATKNMGKIETKQFERGYTAGIAAQVSKILHERKEAVMSDGTSLILCKQAIIEKKYGKVEYGERSDPIGNSQANAIGFLEGLSADLDWRPPADERKHLP